MDTVGIVIITVVLTLVAVAAIALVVRPRMRSRHLQRTFGPEYDRVVEDADDRRSAERELAERERRHADLDLRPLDPETRESYRDEWMRVQERFVDEPAESVLEADRLVTSLMTERGYPTADYEQRLADLSVEHGHTLQRYRAAHDITTRAGRPASTEERREAMVHYRALFEELLDDGAPAAPRPRAQTRPGGTEPDGVPAPRPSASDTAADADRGTRA
ncbi:hypothetical protein [Allonocardiopsis opalescens]|uniref:Secreted protein n=1 Tax=Allonocardiopsis opalescens TaxID=1144618 RepID=A0A2T0Q4C7_9ACTN|nr:hypothetical protein [Allonocardiopsis opalescens]PRX98613.1 hypothetical protein CLV72_104191 [Allonocardiopsis opalescens]